jgi:hypothetical protein
MKKILYACIMLSMALLMSCKDTSDELAPFVTWNAIPGSDVNVDLTTKQYKADETTEFSNPERGMFILVEPGLTSPLQVSILQQAKNKKESIVQLVYYLTDRISTDLTSDDIAKLNRDFASLRESGLKSIVRFAYTNNENKPDAPMNIILRHLDQLKPVFETNKDVIACVQAGFIGAWGEWYYSSNGLNNAASYKQLLDKYLEVLPKDRMIQVRTPKYKKDYLGVQTALIADNAYKGTAASRLGHHNDAFMADQNDMGTFVDATADKEYISQEGLYLPIGGETTLADGASPASGSDAIKNLKLMRWSFLHEGYMKKVLDQWETDGVMQEIRNSLGYRITIENAKYSATASLGGDFVLQLSLRNMGWAPMYNPRNLEVVLRATDGTEYYVKLNDDPRTWKPNTSSSVNATMAIPSNMPEGTYSIFVFLPDAESSIHDRPEYAVRLANSGVWEEKTGYNDLGVTVKISGKASQASKSELKFAKK